ncbi:MAG: DUF3558 domain-containing protein [Gordonia sp. (in: high G+C Gram-positive bacteria)]
MTGRVRRSAVALAAVLALGALGGCTIDGTPQRVGAGDGTDKGAVDTDRYEGLLTECNILPIADIGKVVGASPVGGTFVGAICRWVFAGPVDVTLAWYEWGDFNVEKQTAHRLGFETENMQIQAQAAFTQRDPKRPEICGATAKSPGRGILTWWVEPHGGPSSNPCAAPIKLMELVIQAAG